MKTSLSIARRSCLAPGGGVYVPTQFAQLVTKSPGRAIKALAARRVIDLNETEEVLGVVFWFRRG
jgi:hypothetical protein